MRTILLVLLLAAPAFAQSPSEMARSLRELGSAEFRTREAAEDRLRTWGVASLQPLQDSLAHGNPEANRRAEALIAQIRQRLSDEAAIAPKIVAVSMKHAKVSEVLDELRKQTTYEFRVSGEPSTLAKEIDFDTRGKVPLWAAVAKLEEAAGLGVESVGVPQSPLNLAIARVPQPTLSGEEAVLKEFREKKLLDLELRQTVLLAQQKQLASEMPKANAKDRAALARDSAAVEAELKETAKKIAALKEILAGKANLPSPTGTVFLRAWGKPNSATFTGGIRMEAVLPAKPAAYSHTQRLVAIQFFPEPALRWINVVDAVATKAVDADGREFQHDHSTKETEVRVLTSRGKLSGSYTGTTELKPANDTVIVLSGPHGKTDRLAKVEGLVRANVWGNLEAMLTVRGFTLENSVEEAGPDTLLRAKLVPNPANKLSPYLDVELQYNTARVKPAGVVQESFWLTQGAKGEAVRIKSAEVPAVPRNSEGLSLTDAEGRAFVLNMNQSETTHIQGPDGITNRYSGKIRYTMRPAAHGEIGPPAVLSFHGTRIKTVTFPFSFTDVPLATGTRVDAVTQPMEPKQK